MTLGKIVFFITLIMPIVAIAKLLTMRSKRYTELRNVAISFSTIIFLLTLLLYALFIEKSSFFQYTLEGSWFPEANLGFFYGIDGVSLLLIILTAFLIPVCILCTWESITIRLKTYLVTLFLTEFSLFNAFSVLDLALFYVFFESVLIPMFVMILIWGSRERRVHAAYQFFIYTFLGSLFMLLGILFVYSLFGTTDYLYLLNVDFSFNTQLFLWLSFFLSFAIKVPMVPFHIWLPEAHVEAPTPGSVLLAGVLLKLGTYGFLRFSIPLFPEASAYFSPLLFTMAILGVVYASCTTLRQVDLKKIIAYSSVAHMSLVIVGLFSDSIYGLGGAVFLMLSHGVVSSALFLCVGVLYDRYHTRLITYYGGMVSFMPLFAFLFLSFSMANMGFPGTSAFVGEFLIIMSSFFSNTFVCFFISVGVILSAAYSVWCYNRVMFGPTSSYIIKFSDLNKREFNYLLVLFLIVMLFGLLPNLILDLLHTPCAQILFLKRGWVLDCILF